MDLIGPRSLADLSGALLLAGFTRSCSSNC